MINRVHSKPWNTLYLPLFWPRNKEDTTAQHCTGQVQIELFTADICHHVHSGCTFSLPLWLYIPTHGINPLTWPYTKARCQHFEPFSIIVSLWLCYIFCCSSVSPVYFHTSIVSPCRMHLLKLKSFLKNVLILWQWWLNLFRDGDLISDSIFCSTCMHCGLWRNRVNIPYW